MKENIVFLTWLLLPFFHHNCHARAPDSLLKNCTKSLMVAQGQFNPESVEASDGEQRHTLEWPDFAQPLTFYARTDQQRRATDLAAVVRLEDHVTGQNLTNCYLSGYCTDLLICCYRFRTPEKYQRRYEQHCLPSASCPALNQPCRATCFSEMALNVAFGRNRVEGGGAVHVSVEYNLHRLTQTQEPYIGEEFVPMPNEVI